MDGLYVFAICVVQRIECLGHDRVCEDEVTTVFYLPLNGRVTNGAHAVSAGQKDRTFQKTRLLDPIDAGHIAIAILIERSRKNGIPVPVRSRKNGGNTRANRALARYQLTLAFDESDVAHRHSADIRYPIGETRLAGKWNAEIASSGPILRLARDYRDSCNQNSDDESHGMCSFQAPKAARVR